MRRKVRIQAGRWRGRVLSVPEGIRPTAGRVRESLMDIWGPRLAGARFLDVCAGSAAVGIEALSRGASHLVVVEPDPKIRRDLIANLHRLSLEEVIVHDLELPAALPRLCAVHEHEFDLIFADPPYAFAKYAEILPGLASLLAEDGEIAVEHGSRIALPEFPAGLRQQDARRYGDTTLSFYSRDSTAQD